MIFNNIVLIALVTVTTSCSIIDLVAETVDAVLNEVPDALAPPFQGRPVVLLLAVFVHE